MTIAPGQLLGPYQIEALIGAGGMSQVYKARDCRLNRTVAVKVLVDPVGDGIRKRRFDREAAAIAQLNHPHICRLYDVGCDEDVSYLVIEYLEGETLANRIADPRPLATPVAVQIMREVVDAVHEAHRHGLVHRDLKPSNIMLTADGVKLLDFGLVRSAAEHPNAATASALTDDGTIPGTLQYLSPEQLQGLPAGASSDLFALGVIFYEMLTRCSPFARSTPAATMAAISTDEPPAVHTVRPDVPEAVSRVIARCLAKDPKRRWSDPGALAIALEAIGQADSIGSGASSGTRRSRRASAVTRMAVVPLRNRSADAEEDYLAHGVSEAVTTALSQVGGLAMISPASAQQLAGNANTLLAARRIRTDAFLDGSVLKVRDAIHVAVRLVETGEGTEIWSRTYERDLAQLHDLPLEIARDIATEIQSKSQRVSRRRAPKAPVSPAAHHAFLRARFLWSQRSGDALRASFRHFTAAIELDPDYAQAHAGLADWYVSASVAGLVPTSDALVKARAAATRALRLAPRLAEAHASLGRVATYELDIVTATRELEIALRLNSNLAETEVSLGRLCTYRNEHKAAIAHHRIAQSLDPLSPATQCSFAASLYAAREFDAAMGQARRSLELAAEYGNAFYFIGLCEHFRGEPENAITSLKHACDLSPEHPSPMTGLAYVLAQNGRQPEALQLIAELKERATRGLVTPFDFAEAYTGVGEAALALEHLERSFELRLPPLLGLASDPLFDPLRSEPRFQRLLQQLQLA